MNSLVTVLIFQSIILHVMTSKINFDPNCFDGSDAINCKNSKCPTNTTGTYPHCKCTEKNFDYSIDLNDCFRVCPENSTGYWPNCVCDEKIAHFDKQRFECKICPADSDGVYPNCDCSNAMAKYNTKINMCEYCPDDSTGVIPNCKCNDRTEYDVAANFCSESLYEKAICPDDGLYRNDYCSYCSIDENGTSVDCNCKGHTFIKNCNTCCSCPNESWGDYPNCICEEPFQYNNLINQCLECPAYESEGIYPNCRCQNGLFSILEHRCLTCPDNAIGIYPNCQCFDKEHIFSAYINECYIECPDNAENIHPRCRCYDRNFYYDKIDRVCKSNIGRYCPDLSIGIGPDCLCIEKYYKFDVSSWLCYDVTKKGGPEIFPSAQCPGGIKKWPQCDDSIHRNALLSLVG